MIRSAFDHYDEIKAAPSGAVLMVCDPVKAQVMHGPQSGMITLPAGQFARTSFSAGGLWCKAEVGGRIETVVIDEGDFGSLELKR